MAGIFSIRIETRLLQELAIYIVRKLRNCASAFSLENLRFIHSIYFLIYFVNTQIGGIDRLRYSA